MSNNYQQVIEGKHLKGCFVEVAFINFVIIVVIGIYINCKN